MGSIAAVPGISRTSEAFRQRLLDIAKRNRWPVDAIAAVISRESGFRPDIRNPLPGQTATGLIQFTESTAKMLGTTTDQLANMSAANQLAYVEEYYKRTRVPPDARLVDFYLVGWGARPGLPMGHVLARKGEKVYELNSALDVNGDGVIKVSDLDAALRATIARADGRRIEVTEGETDGPKAERGASPPFYYSASARRTLLNVFSGEGRNPVLVTLQMGSSGSLVALWQHIIGATPDGVFGPKTDAKTIGWQMKRGLLGDGIVGPLTWTAVIDGAE